MYHLNCFKDIHYPPVYPLLNRTLLTLYMYILISLLSCQCTNILRSWPVTVFFISDYFFLRAVIKYFHPKAWKQCGIPIFCWSSVGLDNTLCPCSLVLWSRAIPLPLSPRICNIIPISRLSLQTVFDGSLPCPWVYALVFCFVFFVFIYDAHEMHTISQLKSAFHDNNKITLWGTLFFSSVGFGKFYTFLWSNKNECLCIYPVCMIGLLTNLNPVDIVIEFSLIKINEIELSVRSNSDENDANSQRVF